MSSISSISSVLRLILVLTLSQASLAQTKPNHTADETPKILSAMGRSSFNASCAPCHGLDGSGSDKAANIASSARVQHLSDAQLANIISKGVPGTGMPAFSDLPEKQVHGIVVYLRSLQGKGTKVSLAGDARHGREIFFGKGECSCCHTIAGEGGFLGPELTNHAATSSPKSIREEIIQSPRTPTVGYRTAVLTTASGDRLEGLIRNEDNFSVQVQTKDGTFHLVRKSEEQHLEYTNTSMMPTNYRERLNDRELDDLVSFLLSTADPNQAPVRKNGDFQ